MQPKFWHERWETETLGFHQQKVNPLLEKHWPKLALTKGQSVFVPLCGKSLDMKWLRDLGHPVVGVELSPIAIRDYFKTSSIHFDEAEHGKLKLFSGEGFELYCGDFFELTESDLSQVGAVYDRAALIALPPEMRVRYASRMADLVSVGTQILLLTIEYDQSKMSGPPHSVPPAEVESLFADAFSIEELEAGPIVEPAPYFTERGLDLWQEHLYLMTRRGPKVSAE
jgi:thiopurine S-methyltransferase